MQLKSWLRSNPLVTAIGVVLIPASVALALAQFVHEDLRRGLYTGAVTLVFGGLLGGLLKILLDEVSAARGKRDDAATFVRNVLNDLKSVYDGVGHARIVIPAEQSVKTYHDEMLDLIKARVKLKNVTRAFLGRAEGLTKEAGQQISAEAGKMEKYLERLTDEFKGKYKRLYDAQCAYDKRFEAHMGGQAASGEENVPAIPNSVWVELTSLEELKDFIDGGEHSRYEEEFVGPLDKASGLLRNELAKILRGERPIA